MERREDALREALTTNELETQKWKAYKEEQETAISNLDMFSKRLTVEVMVPIGRKAFIAGELMHTNEVLVGHFQGYFSKCSVHKAKEICEYRLHLAEEELQKYEKEAELWQNKLEKPYVSGALPNANEQEIVEEYNEEEEHKWRLEHAKNIKQWKQIEKQERDKLLLNGEHHNDAEFLLELEQELKELNVGDVDGNMLQELLSSDIKELQKIDGIQANCSKTHNPKLTINFDKQSKSDNTEKSHEDILKMLEEAEKLEDDRGELSKLEVDEESNELVRKLMAGEMELPTGKQRLARVKTEPEPEEKNLSDTTTTNASDTKIPDDGDNNATDISYESDEDAQSSMELQIIKDQSQYLPLEDRLHFYQYQIDIFKSKLKSATDVMEKKRLLVILCDLEDMLDDMIDEALTSGELGDLINSSTDNIDSENENELRNVNNSVPSKVLQNDTNKKRRISFALTEETLEFRRNETVAEMLPKSQPVVGQRDVITLDEPLALTQETAPVVDSAATKQQRILDKVALNLDYVKENESVENFDMVNKILNNVTGNIKTLHITFKHSDAKAQAETTQESLGTDVSLPGSPADFYTYYVKAKIGNKNKSQETTIYVNSYEGEEQVKTPLLSEAKRISAYEDPRAPFSLPNDGNITETTKSILRNKLAVERETHLTDEVQQKVKLKKKLKKQPTIEDEITNMSAYYKVMNDVVEKQPTEPEALPEGNFINAHTPKKRVSRFKQQRVGIVERT